MPDRHEQLQNSDSVYNQAIAKIYASIPFRTEFRKRLSIQQLRESMAVSLSSGKQEQTEEERGHYAVWSIPVIQK